jgi:hypothetical protein
MKLSATAKEAVADVQVEIPQEEAAQAGSGPPGSRTCQDRSTEQPDVGHVRTVHIANWVKSTLDAWMAAAAITHGRVSRFFAGSSGRSTDGSCGSFMEMLGQQIVMLEEALQEPASAAGVTLTVENGAILITPPP